MGILSRQDRVDIHKKQEVVRIASGVPTVSELSEGVTTLRSTDEGLVEYVRYNNRLYKKVLDKVIALDATLIGTNIYATKDGDIGIGTPSPVSSLEIEDGLTTTGAVLTLGTREPSVVANDVLGRINFYAPLETGTDATAVAASIAAVAQASFGASVNSTALHFQTGDSEVATTKMVIDEDGVVLIGRTAAVATTQDPILEVDGKISFDGFLSRAGTGGLNNGANVMNFFWDGSYIDGYVDSSNVWPNEGSDYRIKENIVNINNGILEKINALRPIQFTQKEIGIYTKKDKARASFIAHELQEQFPGIVKGTKDEVNSDGEPVFQSYNNAQLTTYLTKALQELSAKVDTMQAEINNLKEG